MEQKDIDRINELSRLARERELTADEQAERERLRRAYVEAVKASLTAQLERTYMLDAQGNKVPLKKKKD